MVQILDAIEMQIVNSLELEKFLDKPRNSKKTNRLAYYSMLEDIMKMTNNHGGGQIIITNNRLGRKLGLIACCDKIFVKHLEGISGFNVAKNEVENAADILGKLVIQDFSKHKGIELK